MQKRTRSTHDNGLTTDPRRRRVDAKDVHMGNHMHIVQMGAGNGKTYRITQLLRDPAFHGYRNFVYLSKQHSAKYVIHQEFKHQMLQEDLTEESVGNETYAFKKYTFSYQRETPGTACTVTIATVDAFIWALSRGSEIRDLYTNPFEKYLHAVIECPQLPAVESGVFTFASMPMVLSETVVVVDETQDLSVLYADAMRALCRNHHVGLYVMGDKLQSKTLGAFSGGS